MLSKHVRRRCVVLSLVVLSLVAAAPAPVLTAAEIEEPTPGQSGKDVIWLPSEQALVDNMLALAKVTPADFVIDLGSGDGRIVITAARRGARAMGIEYNANLVEVSKRNAARAGVGDKAQFVNGDIFEKDFSQATVLTMFLLPDLNLRLRPKILDMKPGTRIVSNTFDMGEWQPDQNLPLTSKEGCNSSYCNILLWIVPAKVGGLWKLPQGELELQQTFQTVTGALRTKNGVTPIADGRIDGARIQFRIGDARYTGELNGNTLQGTVSGGQNGQWTATR
jgi:SAM-dependent methyltransferase